MAFPSSSGSIPLTLEAAWELARSISSSVKFLATSLIAKISAGPVTADQLVNVPGVLISHLSILTQCASVSGIGSYAQTQVGNSSLDVAASFNSMTAAISSTANWIMTNFPKDANGNLLYQQYNGSLNGTFTYISFTQAQLTGLVSQLNALIATID